MSHKHAMFILYGIIAGVVAGGFTGWHFGEGAVKVKWIGDLFLDALKMTIVPLVITSIISGIASLGDIRRLGKLGGITLAYYFSTTFIAVAIGLVFVNIIQPGAGLQLSTAHLPDTVAANENAGIGHIFQTMISPNLFDAAAHTKILPIILFSIMFAAALTMLGKPGEVVVSFFDGANKAMLKLIGWIMYMAPIGIFSLVAYRLGKEGGGEAFMNEITAVGWHVATVISGLATHFVFLLMVMFFVAGQGWGYLVGMLRALLTAFGTASSSATLPITMECVRENNINERAARFTLPLGSTINMDGTALYEAAAAMFIAQAYGIELGISAQIIVFITATLAAIGAAGIPEAGLVTMIIVLNAVGLPLEGIGILLAVDWFLDRFRTTINVWGDAVGAAVAHRFMPNDRDAQS